MTIKPSVVRNPDLAPMGQSKIDWVSQHMPVLREATDRLTREGTLRGQRVAVCLHLEAKTAYLAICLQEAGCQVSICGSNPLSTQDDVCAALAANGVSVYAWHDCSEEEYRQFIRMTVANNPTLLIDDGGDLVNVLHREEKSRLPHVIGGSEETTTGVLRLRAMAADGALAFPMIAANDARSKYLFDNRYGTGQSVWDGIMRNTNLLVAGKVIVVVGYGWCGKGVALRAEGLGARVIICEVDPVHANEALMDGHDVMPLAEAARLGDIFVTVTGCRDVITRPHFELMKDGALLANAGHFDVEINTADLSDLAAAVRTVRGTIAEYAMADGRRIYLLAQGRLVNIGAADGHPAEIMDMSFGVQMMSLTYLIQNRDKLGKGVIDLPRDIDDRVCRIRLEALGKPIDRLTTDQERYLRSWQ
ncbi:MAG: adenosylhomocysteinase [Thermaerobacterales bacterium]